MSTCKYRLYVFCTWVRLRETVLAALFDIAWCRPLPHNKLLCCLHLLCSAQGWAIGSGIATPEVQANVFKLCILNCCQGKVAHGRPGNQAPSMLCALCEWQGRGVTEGVWRVNGHAVGWTDSKIRSSCINDCITSFTSMIGKYKIHIYIKFMFWHSTPEYI